MSATATDTNGKYVSQVLVTNGVIQVTYGLEANASLAGQTLQIVPWVTLDGSVAWRCGAAPAPSGTGIVVMPGTGSPTGGTLASNASLNRYLPAACRP
jgi:type IV pilus assembly protein PilA